MSLEVVSPIFCPLNCSCCSATVRLLFCCFARVFVCGSLCGAGFSCLYYAVCVFVAFLASGRGFVSLC